MADVLAEALIVIGGQIAADLTSDLVAQLEDVDTSAKETVDALAKIQSAVDVVAEKASKGFGSLSGVTDVASQRVGALGQNVSAAGDTLSAYGLVSEDTATKIAGVTDTLSGIEGGLAAASQASDLASQAVTIYASGLTKLPAVQKTVAVAQKVLNAVMKANPIGLVVTAITLLVAGLVLAYKKSETFRKIVNAAFNGVKAAALAVFGFISKYIQIQVKVWTTIFNVFKKVLSGVWDGLKSAGAAAFRGLLAVLRPIARTINTIIGGINKVLSYGGLGTLPTIPKFASGVTNFRGGLALVGEQGPEIVSLPKGSNVYSNADSQRMSGSGITQNNTFIFQGSESYARARANNDWAAKHGTRFGSATRAVRAS